MRVLLFLAVNFGIMLVLSIAARLLGFDAYFAGGNMMSLLGFCAVMGFGGSFISLALSKWMAKRSMGVQIIEQPRNETEQWLVETVARQAKQAGIEMPEVGYFMSPEPNAFATGMSKHSSLIAVSSGLMDHMSRDEVEAVLGHEVAHAANGDMVTMGLLQGVLNTFVYFFARIIGSVVDNAMRSSDEEDTGPGMGYFIITMIAEVILGFVASMISAWFSRRREFRADEGGATLAGREKMISALQALQRASEPAHMPGEMAAFGIRGGAGGLMQQLFSTHPPLEDRIAALQNGR